MCHTEAEIDYLKLHQISIYMNKVNMILTWGVDVLSVRPLASAAAVSCLLTEGGINRLLRPFLQVCASEREKAVEFAGPDAVEPPSDSLKLGDLTSDIRTSAPPDIRAMLV